MTKNLWGELPEVENVRTPLVILREQASLLTEMTRGVLRGEVRTNYEARQKLLLELMIVVPALNGYQYCVLQALQPLTMYPLRLFAEEFPAEEHSPEEENEAKNLCVDEASFVAALQVILTSPRVRKAIQALLAQSNAA